MRSLKWVLIGVVLAALLLAALWTSCSSVDSTSATPEPVADAVVPEPDPVPVPVVDPVQPEPVQPEPAPEAKPVTVPDPPKPLTLAEQFVEAGGHNLCLAMVHQLNPDWRMDACKAVTDEARRTACENQRRPLVKFADDVCRTVIEESQRLDLDPVLVLAVIERESSFGRAQWNQQDRAYEVQTDVCRLTLPKSRIVDRRPGRREGTELMTWTYGPQAPNAGSVARNRQPVIIVEEDDDRVVLNTCVAGEGGIMQTTPRELRVAGDAIGLTGTTAERRAQVDADPVLQVRVGCQALDEHRKLLPTDAQADWLDWVHAYNTGNPARSEHGTEYVQKIARHYLAACNAWIQTDADDPLTIRDVDELWPECERVRGRLNLLAGDE